MPRVSPLLRDLGSTALLADMIFMSPKPIRMLDFSRYEILTFDCYGTLINWEAGILAALRRHPLRTQQEL